MNNNDILKQYIRERKQSGDTFFTTISGVDIANANRDQLAQWLDDGGFDAQAIITAFRANQPAPVPTNRPPLPDGSKRMSERRTPATPAQSKPEAMNALQAALAALLPTQEPASVALTPEDRQAIIDEIKAEMAPTTTVEIVEVDGTRRDLGQQHKCFPTLLALASQRIDCFLVGPAGSFKTTAAEEVAKALNLQFSAISVCQQTTAVALLGYLNAMGEYVTTEFRKRYEGGGVFLLDEMDNGNANVLAVLNSALANSSCAFPDGMIAKHKDFVLISSGNTYGTGANAQFIGRCQLDAATLDRFAMLEWPYDEGMEMALSGNPSWCRRVQAIRDAAGRLNSKLVVSPRATFKGAKLLAAGMGQREVEQMLIFKGMADAEKSKILSNLR